MKDLDTFGNRLKLLLEKRMWTQRELAHYCKIQETMVSRYIQGINNPSKRTLITICIGLDISPEWLKTGKGTIDDKFNATEYSSKNPKRIIMEKSHLGGYDLTIHLQEEEVKTIMAGVVN